MKRFDLLFIAVVALASANAAHARYDLIYNPNTGSLTIDTKGGPIAGYVLEFEPGQDVFVGPFIVVPNANLIDNTVNANQVPLYQSGVNNRTGFAWYLSDVKLQLGVGIPDPTGIIPIGNVAVPGLTEQQYIDTFSSTRGNYQYVAGEGNGVFDEFNLVYAPEPTSLALLGLGGLVLASRRRAC
ncbi:MAG: PEP-CTERM sorting domain-containing protein [Phycisphaeraceae bacterium]